MSVPYFHAVVVHFVEKWKGIKYLYASLNRHPDEINAMGLAEHIFKLKGRVVLGSRHPLFSIKHSLASSCILTT